MLIYPCLLWIWVTILPTTNGQLSYQPLDLEALNKMLNDQAKTLLEKMELGFESVVNKILHAKTPRILNETMGRKEPAWTDATSDFYHPYSFNKFGGSRTELSVDTLFLERRVDLLDKQEPTDFTLIQVDQIKIFVGASASGVSVFWITSTEEAFTHYEALPGVISLEHVVLPNPVTNSTEIYLLMLRRIDAKQTIAIYKTSTEEYRLNRITNELNIAGDVVKLKHIHVAAVDVHLIAAMRFIDAKTGNSSTTSTIYKLKLMNGKPWIYELLPLATIGVVDMEAFTINGMTYVAVANSFCQVADVFIFDAETNHFHLYQRLPLANATHFSYFRIGYNHFLAGIGRAEAVIFAWEGEGLVLLQSIFAPRDQLVDVRRWHPVQTQIDDQALLLLVRSSNIIDVLRWSRTNNRFIFITEPMCLNWVESENRTGNYAYTSAERYSDLDTAQQQCIWGRQNCLGISKIPEGNKFSYIIEPGRDGYMKHNPVPSHSFWYKELKEAFSCFTAGTSIGRASIVSFSVGNLLFVTIPLRSYIGGFVFILHETHPEEFISETASALASLRNIQNKVESLEQKMNRGRHRVPPPNAMVLNKNQDIVAEVTFDAELSTSNAFDVRNLEVKNIEGDKASLGRYDVVLNEIDRLIKQILGRLNDAVPVNQPTIVIPNYMHFQEIEALDSLTSSNKATIDSINGVNMNDLYRNIVLSNDRVHGRKVFTNHVQIYGNVSVSGPISDKRFPEDIITTNSPQNLSGTWYFEEPIAVTQTIRLKGLLNGVDLSKSVVLSTTQPNRTIPYAAKKVFVDNILVEGDINVGLIDGVDIGHVIRTAVTRSGSQEITAPKTFRKAVHVKGDVEFKGLVNNMNLKHLNSRIVKPDEPAVITGCKTFLKDVYVEGTLAVNGLLKGKIIPDDFVLYNSKPTISGRKIFIHNVKVTGNVFVDKRVDGIPLQTAVTVNTKQIIPGQKVFRGGVTFLNLEVSGTIDHTSIDRLLHKLATQDSLTTDSVKEYDTVNVTESFGPLKYINGLPIDSLMADIVLKTDKNVVMTAPKSYREQSVVNGNVMRINRINNLNLKNDFLTKSGSHVVTGKKTFTKPVVFDTLIVDGLVDNININQFVQNIVRLDIPQDVGGHKTFVDGIEVQGALQVNGYIDSIKIPEDIIHKLNPQPIESQKIFHKGIKGEKVDLDNLIIRNSINGINWRNLNEQRITLNSSQVIMGQLKAKDIIINGDLQIFNQLNGMDLERLTQDAMRKSKPQVVTGPKNFLGQVTVEGNLQAQEGLDGVDLKKLDSLAVKVENDEILNYYKFNRILAKEGIKLNGKVGEVNLQDLIEDVVWKNVPQFITGTKNINTFTVRGSLKLSYLNGIDVNRIVSKTKPQQITGKYIFNGNVLIHGNLNIQGNLNKENFPEFVAKTMKVTGDAAFPNIVFTSDLKFAKHLNVSTTINGNNLQGLARKAVLVDKPQSIKGHKEFKGRLIARHNIQMAGTVNGRSLKEFASDVVLTSGNQLIKGMKTFTANIELYGDLKVDGNVSLKGTIDGVRLEDVDKNVVFVHKPQKITGMKIFTKTINIRGNLLLKRKLNGIDISRDVVTKHGIQTISGVKTFQRIEVDGEITGELINGHHLPSVVADTFKIYGQQEVIGLKTFTQPITFNAPVDVDGKTCNLDFGREVVTLDTPQIITGEKIFMDKLIVKGNADIERINSFELSHLKTLWNINMKNYSADFKFLGSVKFLQDPKINAPLAAVNHFEMAVNSLTLFPPILQAAYNTTISKCQKFSGIVKVAKNAAVKLDHFEYLQTLDVAESSGFYHFSINRTQLLIVGLPFTYCQADHLYQWDSKDQYFVKKGELPPGVATSRFHFVHNNQHYLVIAHKERKCGKLSRLLKFDPIQQKFQEHCSLELGITSITTTEHQNKVYFIAATGSKTLVFNLNFNDCKIDPISANGPCNAASTIVKKIAINGQTILILSNANQGLPTKICRFLPNGTLELIQELDTQLVNSITVIDAYQKYIAFSQTTRITKFTDATINSIQVYKFKINGNKISHMQELYADIKPVLGLESFKVGPRMKPYILNLRRKWGISAIPIDGFNDIENIIHLPMTRSSHMHSFTIEGNLYVILNEIDESRRATIYRLITKGVAVAEDLKCDSS